MTLTRDVVRSGSLVGPLALICESRRGVQAQALTATSVLENPARYGAACSGRYPDAARRLHTTLGEDLSRFMSDLTRVEEHLRAA